jgi:hypothetical protein
MSSIIRATTTSGLQVAPDNSGSLQLQTNGTTAAVTIDTSQNVGIGTTSPSSLLHVSSSGDTLIKVIGGAANARGVSFFDSSTNGSQMYSVGSDLRFFTTASGSSTERMRIDSSGNVLIGTTTYSFSSTNYGIAMQSNGETFWIANTPANLIAFNRNSNGDMFKFFRSGTQVGNVSVTTTNTTYATSSDYRLKENILPITSALNTVLQLKPVTYKWKIDGSDGQGFIAHELQEVVPDCVIGEKDAVDEEGNPKYQGIDTSFLVATLTAAIQEQQTIINDLKARIETLEAK